MKKKYLIGVAILLLVIGYLLYLSFGSSVSYYLTVSELLAEGVELYDTNVRVAGQIADGPVDWNPEELELRFNITEGGQTLSVIYEGAKPSGFQGGASILVEGKYNPDGIFRASQLIMKCPSKYEEAVE
jgi:cytochrome c-type biogenesis protein CcmE